MERRRRKGAAAVLSAGLAATLVMADPAAAVTSSERTMFRLINKARRAHGLRTLRLSGKVSYKARQHSARMARRGYLFHHSCLSCFMNRLDVNWSKAGENVGRGYRLRRIHRAFMRSATHRGVILGRGYRRAGVGVVKRGGRWWVTEILYG